MPELEAMERHGFDEVPRLSVVALDDRTEATAAELERGDPLGHEPIGLAEVDQLAQPLDQEHGVFVRLHLDLACHPRTRAVADELCERREGLGEDVRLGSSLDLELELGGVLDPAEQVVSSSEAP
jgi:hypothetical protein